MRRSRALAKNALQARFKTDTGEAAANHVLLDMFHKLVALSASLRKTLRRRTLHRLVDKKFSV